jgi:hypothetical protein
MKLSEMMKKKREADMVDPTEGIDVMNEEDEEVPEPSQFGPDEVASLSLGEADEVIHDDANFLSEAEVALLERRGYTVIQGEGQNLYTPRDPEAEIPDNKSGFKGYLKGVLKALDSFDPPEAKEMKKYVEKLNARL